MFNRFASRALCLGHRIMPQLLLTLSLLFCLLRFSTEARGQILSGRSLQGHVPSAVAALTPVGLYPATNRLNLAIGLPLRNQTQLKEFLRDLYDPRSSSFHKFLTPLEFAERFGPSEEDYQALIHFAETNGL